MRSFRECGRNCDSLHDIITEPVDLMSDAMADFNDAVNIELEKAAVGKAVAKKNLENWLDAAENCTIEAPSGGQFMSAMITPGSTSTTSRTSTGRTNPTVRGAQSQTTSTTTRLPTTITTTRAPTTTGTPSTTRQTSTTRTTRRSG
jgi:hypothetical protein